MNVDLIDSMGSDLTVVNAARVSFEKESSWEIISGQIEPVPEESVRNLVVTVQLKEADKKLIHYLARHKHWTPFSHPQLTFRITAPIFVARQLFKHKVGLTENEVSRRYVDSEPTFYTPEQWRLRAENKKQGSAEETIEFIYESEGCYDGPPFWLEEYQCYEEHIDDESCDTCGHLGADYTYKISDVIQGFCAHAKDVYDWLLKHKVCPEQARMVLPQSMYTQWYWTGSLAAFARVCHLRLDPHAQQETRYVAERIASHLERLYPVSYQALLGASTSESV